MTASIPLRISSLPLGILTDCTADCQILRKRFYIVPQRNDFFKRFLKIFLSFYKNIEFSFKICYNVR